MSLKIFPGIKALIFDLDGTLSNSLPVHITTWNKVGEELGFKFDPKLIYELTGRPTIEFAQRIANDFNLKTDPVEIVKLKQKAFHNSMEYLSPVKEVIEIVNNNYGILPMAVGTGASRKSAELQLKTLGIIDKFETIVTADDVSKHKPDPETFIKCAGFLQVDPIDCQVFEDGELGIQAAEKAGMKVTDVRKYINYGEWIHS